MSFHVSPPLMFLFGFLLPLAGCNLHDEVSLPTTAPCPQGCPDAAVMRDAALMPQDMSPAGRLDLLTIDAQRLDAERDRVDLDAPDGADASCGAETDEAFCQRLGACSILKRPDNCGRQRQVNCGNSCSAGEVCQDNACVCPELACEPGMCGTVKSSCASIECGGCDQWPTSFKVCWSAQCTSNQCVYSANPGEKCTEQSCKNGVYVSGKTCGDQGECEGPGRISSCGSYACNGDVCFTSCTKDTQCAPRHSCIELNKRCI